jgi:hypothetical protein
MEFINTDGMSFLGPGSEWFWTAVSAGVLLATLLAIYRQVLLQRGLKEAQQSEDLAREWDSERFLRARLAIALALQGGQELDQSAALSSATRIVDYWDKVGSLVRYGHVGRKQVTAQWADIILTYWTMLAPMVKRLRIEHGMPNELEHIEWLANLMLRDGHEHARALSPLTPDRITAWIEVLREDIALEVSLRTPPTAAE